MWVRAPRITIASFDEVNGKTPGRNLAAAIPVLSEKAGTQTSTFYYRVLAAIPQVGHWELDHARAERKPTDAIAAHKDARALRWRFRKKSE